MLSFGDVKPHADKIKRAGALLICQVQTFKQVAERGVRPLKGREKPDFDLVGCIGRSG